MEYNIHRAFTLLRTGMLPDEMIKQVEAVILPSKQNAAVVRSKLMSELVDQ